MKSKVKTELVVLSTSLLFGFNTFPFFFCTFVLNHSAGDVVKPVHNLGVDVIADELLERFGDQDFSYSVDSAEQRSDVAVDFRDRLNDILQQNNVNTADCGNSEGGVNSADYTNNNNHSAASLDLNHVQRTDPNTKSSAAAATETEMTNKTYTVPKKVTTRPLHLRKVVGGGGILDKDLTAYFMQEDSARRLSNMGFYEKDDFMNFD